MGTVRERDRGATGKRTALRLTANIDEFSPIQIRVQLSPECLLIKLERFRDISKRNSCLIHFRALTYSKRINPSSVMERILLFEENVSFMT